MPIRKLIDFLSLELPLSPPPFIRFALTFLLTLPNQDFNSSKEFASYDSLIFLISPKIYHYHSLI